MSTTTQHIEGPAGQLHVDDGGIGGVPVVFVHSFGGSGSHWPSQLSHARATRRAVTFDLRGHGQSAAPADNEYRVESLAEDLAAVIDGLQLERVVQVGHGLGASVATAHASEKPDRVAGLLLVVTSSNDTPIDLHNVLPDLPHVRIEGTSHWPQLDKPNEFNRYMDEFLAQIR